MRHGETVEIVIEKLAFEGKAVARIDGMVVFVEGAVPGDTVRALITKAKKNFAEARALAVITPSPLRVTPQCMHFGVCGGCTWQHVQYPAQVEWKRALVVEALEHIGGFSDIPVEPTIASERPFYYRNKMEFTFSDSRWRVEKEFNDDPFTLGMHVPDNFYKVLHVEQCLLQSENSNKVLHATRDFVRRHNLSIWHNNRHVGYMRFIGIRESATTPDFMVNLVTSTDDRAMADAYAEHLRETCPFVTTVVNNITARKSQTSRGDSERIVTGSGVIREHLAGLEYVISANSFFQTNTRQAEALYRVTAEFARLTPNDMVWDLYCGTGTIGLSIAKRVTHVVGIEIVEDSIADARRNAAHNGITNIEFFCGDLKDVLRAQTYSSAAPFYGLRPECVIVDPPRSGLHEDVIASLMRAAPERIVYVSCNPATLARDLKIFSTAYTVDKVQPVDMFPHTYHIEAVGQLTRRA